MLDESTGGWLVESLGLAGSDVVLADDEAAATAVALAAFLAGPESSFITGAEHFLDGGLVQV